MDVCQLVEKELEKVLSKFSALREHTQRALGDITTSVDNIRKEISEVPEDRELTATQSLVLSQCLRRVRDTVSRLSTEHKDLHSTVSRVGKAIDRNFKSDFSSITTAGAFEGDDKQKTLNKVVCEHFLRQGMLDIAEALNEEADLNLEESRKEPFLELHRILEALKEKNLEPALKWAEANRTKLMAQNSSLEFKLHRLQFISLIRQGQSKQHVALTYSKKFAPFASQHAKDLQVLMGSLLYLHQDIEKSPYAYLLDPIYWAEICDVFTRDACALMGLSVESPLTVRTTVHGLPWVAMVRDVMQTGRRRRLNTIATTRLRFLVFHCTNLCFIRFSMRAGCIALPPLLSIRQVMQQRHCTSVWTAKDELPVEIDLGSDYHYHSIFACPILRQQSSDNNPPMRLICGHVISQDALNKLTNGTKVKCPYCPIEQIPADAKRIYF